MRKQRGESKHKIEIANEGNYKSFKYVEPSGEVKIFDAEGTNIFQLIFSPIKNNLAYCKIYDRYLERE